jgi:hypothetical protein
MEKDYILGLHLDHTNKLYAFTCRSLNRNKNWKLVANSDSIVYEHDSKLFTVLLYGSKQECTALQPMFDMVYRVNGYTPTLVKPDN